MSHTQEKATEIHPTAIVDAAAQLGTGVSVGAYSVIGPQVTVGDRCVIHNHVSLHGPTRLGSGNTVFPYASIGQIPQDKKFRAGEASRLEIGNDNVFRESVTVNRGTEEGGIVTRVGNRNWIMAYCHIAHDCQVGDDTIFANGSTLAGHVVVENLVYLGGFTAIHQFCSIGEMAMTGGHTMIAQDVPPYVIASGNRAQVYGVNRIGLERNGLSPDALKDVQRAYKIFYRSKLKADEALTLIEAELAASTHAMRFAAFVRASTRGICR